MPWHVSINSHIVRETDMSRHVHTTSVGGGVDCGFLHEVRDETGGYGGEYGLAMGGIRFVGSDVSECLAHNFSRGLFRCQ